MNAIQRKSLELKLKELTDAGEFSGYASVFGVKDSAGDIVQPGAFAKTLKAWHKRGRLPPMLWQHDVTEPVGVYKSMTEDEHGLVVEGKILLHAGETERRAYEHLKAGTIDGLSIGYRVPPGGVEHDAEQGAFLLKHIDLFEVSLVTFPANGQARVDEVKAALDGGPKEFERFLRDAGLSRSQAKGLMARGYEALRERREADGEGEDEEQFHTLLNTLRAMRESR